jgi:predicted lipoprotein
VEFLRFGPAAEQNRLERLAFWPDPRGVMQRQLAALLAKKDPALLEASELSKQSAAIQGLPALEAVLTDARHPAGANDEEGHYRCGFAVAAAANAAVIVHEMDEGWVSPQGWRMKMLASGSDNPLYRDAGESAAQLVRSLLTGLQLIQEHQVVPELDALIKKKKPPRQPYARAGASAAYLRSGLSSLQSLYGMLGLDSYVPEDKAWIKAWVPNAFAHLNSAVAIFAKDPEDISDPERLRALRMMKFHLNGMRHIIGRVQAEAAGLTIGFNELDGD